MNSDTPVSLSRARRAKARPREIVLSHSDGTETRYALEWPDAERLAAVPFGQIIARLSAANFAIDGRPVDPAALSDAPLMQTVNLLAMLDAELLDQQTPSAPPEPRQVITLGVTIGGQRHEVSLLPWGSAFADCGGDPLLLRRVLHRLGVAIDGKRLPDWQLNQLDGGTIRHLAESIEIAGARHGG